MPHIINTKGPTHVLEKGAILTSYEQLHFKIVVKKDFVKKNYIDFSTSLQLGMSLMGVGPKNDIK